MQNSALHYKRGLEVAINAGEWGFTQMTLSQALPGLKQEAGQSGFTTALCYKQSYTKGLTTAALLSLITIVFV